MSKVCEEVLGMGDTLRSVSWSPLSETGMDKPRARRLPKIVLQHSLDSNLIWLKIGREQSRNGSG